jgi:hypothetical protein
VPRNGAVWQELAGRSAGTFTRRTFSKSSRPRG